MPDEPGGAASAHLPGMDTTDNTDAITPTTARAGSLTLTVWPDEPVGEHQRYAYRIHDTTSGETIEGRDLFTGAGAPVDPGRALRELAGFLSAAGEARQYALDNPGAHPENEGLFPAWTAEAARRNYTDLAMLAESVPELPEAGHPEQTKVGPRWISVVFLQGDEAGEVLDLLDRHGVDAAIDHLTGYDYGTETTQAALENGYVYDAPPVGALDRTVIRDGYALTYNPFLGYVSLLRAHTAPPDPTLRSGPAVEHPGTGTVQRRPTARHAAADVDPFAAPARPAPGTWGPSL